MNQFAPSQQKMSCTEYILLACSLRQVSKNVIEYILLVSDESVCAKSAKKCDITSHTLYCIAYIVNLYKFHDQPPFL